jgi:hypothetical protein
VRQGQPGNRALSLRDQRERQPQWLGTPVKWIARTAVMHGWRPWPNSKRARPSWMICALRSPQADVVRGCVDAVWAT